MQRPRRLTDKPVGYEPSIVSSNLAGGTEPCTQFLARTVDTRQVSHAGSHRDRLSRVYPEDS